MKKLKFLICTFLVAGFTLTSCSSDDDSNSGSTSGNLVGKWIPTTIEYTFNGEKVVEDYEHEEGCNKDYTQFLSNGISKSVSYFGSTCIMDEDTGNYTVNGNILTINNVDEEGETETIVAEIITLNSTQLKVKLNHLEEHEANSNFITFTKANN